MPEGTLESTPEATNKPTKKRPYNGVPLPEGQANPASATSRLIRRKVLDDLQAEIESLKKAESDRLRAETERDPDGGVVTAARMRKVLGQMPESDIGPTDAMLRQWLSKDGKGYLFAADEKDRQEKGDAEVRDRLEELEDENARLKKIAELAKGTSDGGTLKVKETIDRLINTFPSN